MSVLVLAPLLALGCKSGGGPSDGAAGDGTSDRPWPDGGWPDAEWPDGEWPDGEWPDGTGPDGPYPDGTDPDGTYPDGTDPDGTFPDGTYPDGGPPDGTFPDLPPDGRPPIDMAPSDMWPDGPPPMVLVPGGEFTMGCGDEAECPPEARPAHPVTVAAFLIDEHEVTRSEWDHCYYSGACSDFGCGMSPLHPVACVRGSEAHAFCRWAGKRLCTEAEWEKAARGTDGRPWPWGGAALTCERSNPAGCAGEATPVRDHPTGASPYGALDLSGNVWEWVADEWHAGYEGAPVDGSAWRGDGERGPVIRGGAWSAPPNQAHSWSRAEGPREGTDPAIGLRCCRAPD